MHQKILVIDERAFIFSGSWTVYQFQNCYDTCMELDTAHIEQVREWFNKLVAHTYIFEPGYQEYEPVKITKTRNTTFPTFFYGYLRKIYRTLFSLCEETTILCEIATHYAVTTLSKALIPLKKSEREWPSHKLQFFNKSGEARLLMCEAIKSAKNTIHVANYDLSDITVANMLADRCRQGIQVIIITQYRSHRKAHYCRKLLRWTRGEVRTLAEKNNLMHHKFMTIDNTYAFISTINFSTRSLDRDLESCYISTQEDIISLLNKEIRSLMSTITFAGDPHAQQ